MQVFSSLVVFSAIFIALETLSLLLLGFLTQKSSYIFWLLAVLFILLCFCVYWLEWKFILREVLAKNKRGLLVVGYTVLLLGLPLYIYPVSLKLNFSISDLLGEEQGLSPIERVLEINTVPKLSMEFMWKEIEVPGEGFWVYTGAQNQFVFWLSEEKVLTVTEEAQKLAPSAGFDPSMKTQFEKSLGNTN